MAEKADFGYINARIRGMKSRLLDKGALESLILLPDTASVMEALEKTVYGPEIHEAKSLCSGIVCIDTALRKNFARSFRKILHFVKGTNAEELIAIFLQRWDIQNIKTILRGKKMHVPNEEILGCLVSAGELDDVTLAEAIRQPDVRAVIDLLATWDIRYAVPLTAAYPEFQEAGDLVILEIALDRFAYRETLGALSGKSYNVQLVRDVIRTEIDITNLKTIFRFLRDGTDLEEAKSFFIDGGKEFDRKALESLYRRETTEAVFTALKGTPYDILQRVPEKSLRAGKISAIEKEFDRLLIAKGMHAFFGDPLSIAPVIGYFWAKSNEITNLRIITHMKVADIPEENLREELCYV